MSYPIFAGSWIYFRKPSTDNNQQLEIFSDKESMINLMTRIKKRWTIFGITCLALIVSSLLITVTLSQNTLSIAFLAVSFVLIFGLYGKMCLNLTQKIKQLQQF